MHPATFTVNRFTTAILLATSLSLTACGGSDSSSSSNNSNNTTTPTNTSTNTTTPTNTSTNTTTDTTTVQTGVFIDAPVKGLTYKTASQSGTTNASGQFKYKNGETVTFSLDGVTLGSTTAQPIVPVTLISKEEVVAQFLQTLDTDPADAVIDVSGLKLETSDAAFKTKLEAAFQTANDLDKVLTAAAITQIETASQKDIVNTQLVSAAAAAQHVLQQVGKTALQNSDFAGKVLANPYDDDMYIFNADGTGTVYSAGDDKDKSALSLSWHVTDGNLIASFGNSGKQGTFQALGASNTVFEFYVDAAENTGLGQWAKAQSFTPALLNGKHFQMDMTGESKCTEATVSFSGNTVEYRAICNGTYGTQTATLASEAGMANLLRFKGLADGEKLVMLRSGSLSQTADLLFVHLNADGSLDDVQEEKYTAVSSPLQQP